MALLTFADVAKHASSDDCWFILNDEAYDVTAFLDEHPGGSQVILDVAGRDCTEAFLAAHPASVMKLTLGPKGLAESYKGKVDTISAPVHTKAAAAEGHGGGFHGGQAPPAKTGLQLAAALNVHDFEAMAEQTLVASGKKQAWDYYSSGAADELTYRENICAFQRLWLKPRILVDVATVDTSCSILGDASSLPAPGARARAARLARSDRGDSARVSG